MRDEPTARGRAPESRGGRGIVRPWLIASVGLLAAAGALLYFAHADAAFVAGTLGVCAWFYQMRADLTRKHDLVKLSGRNWVPRSEAEELEELDEGEDEDEA
jgi:hypothetical protein